MKEEGESEALEGDKFVVFREPRETGKVPFINHVYFYAAAGP